jgi:hypothetical protein
MGISKTAVFQISVSLPRKNSTSNFFIYKIFEKIMNFKLRFLGRGTPKLSYRRLPFEFKG